MSRQRKINLEAKSEIPAEMVEINLNGSEQFDKLKLEGLLKAPLHQGYPYGYSEAEPEPELYFCKKSNSTGQLAEKVAGKQLDHKPASGISCLRQMYCPACHERLHEQGVRLERLLTLCCFPLPRSPDSCQVICGKCGYSMGAWKRQ